MGYAGFVFENYIMNEISREEQEAARIRRDAKRLAKTYDDQAQDHVIWDKNRVKAAQIRRDAKRATRAMGNNEELSGTSFPDDEKSQSYYKALVRANQMRGHVLNKKFHRHKLSDKIKQAQSDATAWNQMGYPTQKGD